VYKENQREWEEFSVEAQGWRREGFAFQSMFPDALTTVVREHDEHDEHDHRFMVNMDTVQNISEFIFRVIDGVPTKVVVVVDLMMPLW
jgi:hypothetical protein